jgi:hypothetical protein
VARAVQPARRTPPHDEAASWARPTGGSSRSLAALSPDVRDAADLANGFARLVRERDADGLAPWLDRARATGLRGFAQGLLSDIDAVRAALSLPWSNGPAEGQINRLKLLKRQMYGRAKFDLLRSRVLHAPDRRGGARAPRSTQPAPETRMNPASALLHSQHLRGGDEGEIGGFARQAASSSVALRAS